MFYSLRPSSTHVNRVNKAVVQGPVIWKAENSVTFGQTRTIDIVAQTIQLVKNSFGVSGKKLRLLLLLLLTLRIIIINIIIIDYYY